MTAQGFSPDAARQAGQLPTPSADELAHSAKLQSLIVDEIERSGGAIPFSGFMEMALHAPGLGYYSAGMRKFGQDGDFVTAPELTPLFGRALARQCAQVLAETGGSILEFGAGSGRLAVDLLGELEVLGALPDEYLILELSGDLRQRQQVLIEKELPNLANRVRWLDQLPEVFSGVVIANEVLDAMPVELFETRGNEVLECTVTVEDGMFAIGKRLAPVLIAERVRALGVPDGYRSELNLRAQAWIAGLGKLLQRGLILLIDYGFPGREYYLPERNTGTLMCHYRHRAHTDALALVGLQDITAHVDFTAVAEAALAANLDVSGFTTQAAFLLGCGLLELVEKPDDGTRKQAILDAQAVKKLTMPSEMGELFKVMALSRDIDLPLNGFQLQDQRFRL